MKVVGINIKKYRSEKNLTLRAFAKQIGLSASFLSQVESGKTAPSLVTLKAIADHLNVTVGELIGEKAEITHNPVMRARDRKSAKKIGEKIKIYMLTSPDPSKQMEPMLFCLDKDAQSGGTFYKHFGQEFVLVLKGSLEIILNNTKYILNKGDSMYFNSHVPHAFRNVAHGETEALWVDTPPTF